MMAEKRKQKREKIAPLIREARVGGVYPSLACKLSLNSAIVLDRVHFWTQHNRLKKSDIHFREDRWWCYNSWQQWLKEFCWWSLATVERTFEGLVNLGVLVRKQFAAPERDVRWWYAIDYAALRALIGDKVYTPVGGVKMTPPMSQNDPLTGVKLTPPPPQNDPPYESDCPPFQKSPILNPVVDSIPSSVIGDDAKEHAPDTSPMTPAAPDFDKIWQLAKAMLEVQADTGTFDMWISDVDLLGMETPSPDSAPPPPPLLILSARNEYQKAMLESRLYRTIQRILRDFTQCDGIGYRVQIVPPKPLQDENDEAAGTTVQTKAVTYTPRRIDEKATWEQAIRVTETQRNVRDKKAYAAAVKRNGVYAPG